jgi:AcrR family transcriptional regulator
VVEMPEPTPATPDPPGVRRRSGPRPGNTRSRRQILEAAKLAFAANGYAGTSMRGVAREAGVDPSLIVHFFQTKAGLFSAVVEWPYDGTRVAADIEHVEIDALGAYSATTFFGNWEADEQRDPMISMIQAALADPAAAALLREYITVNFALPLVTRAGTDQPLLRAGLIAAQLMGMGLARYALAFDALRNAPTEQLIAVLGESIQRSCTGPIPPA